MGNIRVLPELIANKIAAGEVVERPASVVKELIENSLDAGSTSIDVVIENGGKSLIRVSDNGSGMDRDDAKLAFARHATSKIVTLQDLESIRSFGFRGEALPSIGAVSRARLVTRSDGTSSGTEVVVEGGMERAVQEHPTRRGTIVEVRDLFFNTPARRKFLKSDSTEMGHVVEVVSHMALSALGVHWTFKLGGKTVLELPPTKNLVTRVTSIFGEAMAEGLLELGGGKDDIRLSGLIGKPSLTRANRREIHLFVNGRWVRSLPFSFALQAGYHGLLMHGRYPVAILLIEVDAVIVDVNVHPTKQEVRLSNEAEVTALIKRLVEERLSRSGDLAPRLPMPSGQTVGFQKEYVIQSDSASTPTWGTLLDRPSTPLGYSGGMVSPLENGAVQEPPILVRDSLQITRVLGQIHNTFIVAETTEGLMIIDQHAAHERVMFETLLTNFQSGQAERQSLLLEEVLELHPRQLELFKKSVPMLNKIGFELEEFGEKTFVIRAVPAIFGQFSAVELLTTFLEEQEDGKLRTGLEDHREAMAALCACKKQSVKAHEPIPLPALRTLLQRLARCENPFTCPHGRPVFFTQSFAELEKQFKRV